MQTPARRASCDRGRSQPRASLEIAYCERILKKSCTNVLRRILPEMGVVTWRHYPEPDVYDAEHGAQWYYHCHDDSAVAGEHGHFHCFARPEGRDGPPCHLIAIAVDAHGRLRRLFTVNHWVVGGTWYVAQETNRLLGMFNVELATPDYLVNRWLTAVVARYEVEIARLNVERDSRLEAEGRPHPLVLQDRTLEVLSRFGFKPAFAKRSRRNSAELD